MRQYSPIRNTVAQHNNSMNEQYKCLIFLLFAVLEILLASSNELMELQTPHVLSKANYSESKTVIDCYSSHKLGIGFICHSSWKAEIKPKKNKIREFKIQASVIYFGPPKTPWCIIVKQFYYVQICAFVS